MTNPRIQPKVHYQRRPEPDDDGYVPRVVIGPIVAESPTEEALRRVTALRVLNAKQLREYCQDLLGVPPPEPEPAPLPKRPRPKKPSLFARPPLHTHPVPCPADAVAWRRAQPGSPGYWVTKFGVASLMDPTTVEWVIPH